ncbi:MAG: hypothetical protein IKY82_08980 [Alistipes sp.]|nr:hypothetical protein [Alistipes sp.]
MKRIFTILVTILFFASSISAQENQEQEAVDTTAQKLMNYAAILNNFGKALPQEKVYLHLDNTSYYQGDKIWFQAYVVTSDYNKPTTLSRTLYVELLNAGGTIVNKQVLPIVDGRCNGDFHLNHLPFHSGFFEIRAYTKYMTNFGEDVIFSRIIPVFDKPEQEGNFIEKRMMRMRTKNGNYIVKREWEERNDNVVVKFFPEGGNLVAGLQSQVAFEITDQGGAPLDIKGVVKSSNGETKAEMIPTHEGRGVFTYTPAQGDKASVELNGKKYNFDLPKALEQGAVMQIDNISMRDSVKVSIAKSKNLETELMAAAVICGGKLFNFNILDFSENDSFTFTFNKRRLPAGVARIVLTDPDGNIVADRMFFANKGKRGTITVESDKESYEPFDKVKLTLSTNDYAGRPMLSPISLSVRDNKNEVEARNSILVDLLLMSEIKGYVHKPFYYFESDDEEHRTALDQLLMVQGWRRYDWELWTGQKELDLKYMPEQGIEVHGQILRYGTDKPMTDIQLSSLLSLRGNEEDSETQIEEQASKAISNMMSIAQSQANMGGFRGGRGPGGPGGFRGGRGGAMQQSSAMTSLGTGSTTSEKSKKEDKDSEEDDTTQKEKVEDVSHFGILDVDSLGRFSFVGNMQGKWHLTLAVTNDKNRKKWSRITLDRNFSPKPRPYSIGEMQITIADEEQKSKNHNYAVDSTLTTDKLPEFALDTLGDSNKKMSEKTHRIDEVEVKGKRTHQQEIYKAKSEAVAFYDIPSEIDNIRDAGESVDDVRELLASMDENFIITRASVGTLSGGTATYGVSEISQKSSGATSIMDGESTSGGIGSSLAVNSVPASVQQWNITYKGREPLIILNYERQWGSVAGDDMVNLAAIKSIYISEDLGAIAQYADIDKMTQLEATSRYSCVVFIETYPEGKIPVEPARGVRKTWIDGYSKPSEFYSPDYTKLPKDIDYRRTLYWNPAVVTDENGKATVEFYNNASCKTMTISAETLTSDGTIGMSE